MPVVQEIELIPAQLKRLTDRLLNGLMLCEDEEDLQQWLLEPDLAVIREYEIWAQFMNEEIEKQNITIEQRRK